MKCAHSQCSNSFVFMFILSNFALLFEVYGKILATWDNEPLRTEHRMGHTFSLYTKCRKLCRQRDSSSGPDRTENSTTAATTTRACVCSHFRDTFPSTFLCCGFENSKIFRASVHPIVQLPRQSVYPSIHPSILPFIHPFTHPSVQRFVLVHQMLSRGGYFRSVHKYLARQLHLALSRGVYSALVCIISNLLNIFHIINFNYLCSLSLFFSILELISIRKGKRVEQRDKTRQLAGEGRFHGASLSLITIGRAFVLDFSMSPLPFATMTRV